MAKHNKKRNVGLLHEQLIRFVSESVVEKNKSAVGIATQILESHFKPGTELYREFRLFNSLVHTRVESEDLARKIIIESKKACTAHDPSRLTEEKSKLIRDINHKINDSNFYDKKISEYRVYSTVQALLNEWRGTGNLYPEEIASYEASLEKWLTRSKKQPAIRENADANPLVLNVMIEKFNKKYDGVLGKDQKNLLSSVLSSDSESIVESISQIKTNGLSKIKDFYKNCSNDFLLKKKSLITEKVENMKVDNSDLAIERALALSALINEMESDDE